MRASQAQSQSSTVQGIVQIWCWAPVLERNFERPPLHTSPGGIDLPGVAAPPICARGFPSVAVSALGVRLFVTAKRRGARGLLVAMEPTGMTAKVGALEELVRLQHEELTAQRQEIERLRGEQANIEQHFQAQLQDLKQAMLGDIQRMQGEVKKHFTEQGAENGRLQQLVTTLKGEKTAMSMQISTLQRRMQKLEEHVGST